MTAPSKHVSYIIAVPPGRYMRCYCGRVLAYHVASWVEMPCPDCHITIRFEVSPIDKDETVTTQ